MKKIIVVAAIVINDKTILCVQRNNKGEAALKWEFPGGKIELGETCKEALIREIEEELKTIITVDEYFVTIEHQYEKFHLTMYCYKCTSISDIIVLNEHINYCWLPINKLNTLDWAPADWPIIKKLESEGI